LKGRKPIPAKLHLLHGNPGKRKPKTDIPIPPSEIPSCPPHLNKEAQAEWDRMAIELKPLGLLTKIDKAIFASYCQAWSTWVEASKKVVKEGMITISPNGWQVENSYFSIMNKAMKQMNIALTELGMSPSSRSRIKIEKPKQEDDEDRFLNGR